MSCHTISLVLKRLRVSISQSEESAKSDQSSRWVDHPPFVLGGSPVSRVLVVEVMPSLSESNQRDEPVISWEDILVEGSGSEHVANRVDAPSRVQGTDVSQARQSHKVVEESTSNEDHTEDGWKNEAHECRKKVVVLFLEHNDLISHKILHVNKSSLFNELIRFLNQEPANVREEEPSGHGVWVQLGIAELVVKSVISGPVEDRSLEGHGVTDHQEPLQRVLRLIGLVSPKSVCSSSDSESSEDVKGDPPSDGFLDSGRVLEEHVDDSTKSNGMYVRQEDTLSSLEVHSSKFKLEHLIFL